jgi:hypothetical protein
VARNNDWVHHAARAADPRRVRLDLNNYPPAIMGVRR